MKILEHINELQAEDIVLDEAVKSRFIEIWESLWGNGEAAYNRESNYFLKALRENNGGKLLKGTKFSIFAAFIDLAVSGLSLEPGTKALCYLEGRNVKIGKKPDGKDLYEGAVTLTISAYGELMTRIRSGQIRHADNPVVVYKEDSFSFSDNDGRKSIKYTCNLPHESNKIVACFMRITRCDGSTDYGIMFPEDWGRLRNYSAKKNKKWDEHTRSYIESPNALYTANGGDIDVGFLKAKCIRHSFSTYPKPKLGKYTILETECEPEETDFYGDDEPVIKKEDSFVPEPPVEKGVINENDDPDEPF